MVGQFDGRREGLSADCRVFRRVLRLVCGDGMMAITSETRSCRECGKPLPLGASYNTLYCPDCARNRTLEHRRAWQIANRVSIARDQKETYEYYKSRRICVSCHSREVATLPDGRMLTQCELCAEKRRGRYYKNYKKKA